MNSAAFKARVALEAAKGDTASKVGAAFLWQRLSSVSNNLESLTKCPDAATCNSDPWLQASARKSIGV